MHNIIDEWIDRRQYHANSQSWCRVRSKIGYKLHTELSLERLTDYHLVTPQAVNISPSYDRAEFADTKISLYICITSRISLVYDGLDQIITHGR